MIIHTSLVFSTRRRALANNALKIATIVIHQRVERFQVMWHSCTDLLFGQSLCQRDLDRSIERQDPRSDLTQDFYRLTQSKIIAEYSATELATRDFDLLRQRYLLISVEQRDFAHLT